MVSSSTAARAETYLGDGTSGVYIAFAQVEALSYPTSLMLPTTEGGTTSRVGDAITNAGNQSLFSGVNSSGTLYAEIAALTDGGSNIGLGLNDGTSNNTIYLSFTTSAGQVVIDCFTDGVLRFDQTYSTGVNTETLNKYAIRWALGEFDLYFNGTKVITGNNLTVVPIGFTTLDLRDIVNGRPFYGKTKAVAVFDYLSDAEMSLLTSP